ncbi:Hypothetical_protein [Hexamita inflata]|uniref:Hypothetical_protein n=1 Tax=Hexamita inflata TaxID=28002 RepID=A0AA86NYI6_9EUKA|nr:Hypothetical protein HINF_LOCUS14721 [Hexamita inflata]CAI9927079.1 Hypothetical protein HINF_LOCUS14724 [Hexamita inflata]
MMQSPIRRNSSYFRPKWMSSARPRFPSAPKAADFWRAPKFHNKVLIQAAGTVVFEKCGQVLIVDRETLMIYVDSFNQFVGQQLGYHVGNEMNQSTLNLIQSKASNIIKLDNIIVSSCFIDANLIYVMYLRVPVKYTSVTYNRNLFSNAKFKAQDLCFNLTYYDQQ